jgi:hypothetical protein
MRQSRWRQTGLPPSDGHLGGTVVDTWPLVWPAITVRRADWFPLVLWPRVGQPQKVMAQPLAW